MTIPALIDLILGRLLREQYADKLRRKEWYADGVRRFLRDKPALTKAIARYGYECHRRGWEFDAEKLFSELTTLLDQIRTTGADIRYLPTYLEGAVDRSIRLEADRLNEDWKRAENGCKTKRATPASKAMASVVNRFMAQTPGVIVREPSGAEILATLYRDLKKRDRARKPEMTTSRLL